MDKKAAAMHEATDIGTLIERVEVNGRWVKLRRIADRVQAQSNRHYAAWMKRRREEAFLARVRSLQEKSHG